MSFFSSLDVSASGLTAERLRMDIIAGNLANATATRSKTGGPYRRKVPVFASVGAGRLNLPDRVLDHRPRCQAGGVRVVRIAEDESPPRMVYNPGHPDAGADGYVAMPNVNVVTEMVDMISATRAYEANLAAINASKAMAAKALEIGK